ncbi:hypothetical protein [Novosphingobium mangrovi (ex Hu et al. 2023)]|uniref:Uncharacterized protein n=1 Tax=Novosphingobium mangrovi (ex Hu et al. 2023) TaxID=2930094 RepID=A0ABT0A9N1_9SPHN|nr:hypothetical protein [Novosphingobium mangrovi (ex Hu et al. 2023)]MCJ1959898.1 hypothetical protein [Novosphingobium mangrovi (ex Hu et al. 2023)]
MTLAQTRLGELATWLSLSSRSRKAPVWGTILTGRYASIVPYDFSLPPRTDFDAEALPLFVSSAQAEGVSTGPIEMVAPASQVHMPNRLIHITKKAGVELPPLAVVGLDDADEPIADAVQRLGADAVDLDAYPLLCAPLWALSEAERAELAHKLPVLP